LGISTQLIPPLLTVYMNLNW